MFKILFSLEWVLTNLCSDLYKIYYVHFNHLSNCHFSLDKRYYLPFFLHLVHCISQQLNNNVGHKCHINIFPYIENCSFLSKTVKRLQLFEEIVCCSFSIESFG